MRFEMSELKLDINKALQFLDMLDPNGRHTIASEAPFGGKDGGPKWEGGATYEAEQRSFLIEDIQKRQARKSNVYYSVNRPCKIGDRQGAGGKNNVDDITVIRAWAFDIDFTKSKTQKLIDEMLSFFDNFAINELKPSLIISTGGGFQIIYLLEPFMRVMLYRKQPITDEQKDINKEIVKLRSRISEIAHSFETMLRKTVPNELPIKIDNMSNIDRVMRLPGTVNYPKAEKQAKGQMPALAEIIKEYKLKLDISQLAKHLPVIQAQPRKAHTFIPRKNDPWTPYEKAKACIDYIRDNGLADSNEAYTIHVMLPLIGAIHDDNEHNRISIEEAEELFLEAVSGGERYGVNGRGEGYFRRQWRSHRPEIRRNGTKSIGGLVWFCTENGFKLPWKNVVSWEPSFTRQQKELSEKRDVVPSDVASLLKKN
jgi:hypothetical protein